MVGEGGDYPAGERAEGAVPADPARKSFAQVLLDTRSPPKVSFKVKNPDFTEQGEPAVFFSADEIQASCEHLQFAAIAKCSYGRPSIPDIRAFLIHTIHIKPDCVISRLNARHILIRFTCEDDLLKVLIQKSVYIRGFLFRFFRWTREFQFNSDPSTIPVWIGFPSLPVNFFHEDMLRSIAGNIGYVLRVHDASLAMTDTSEALVCVELDLNIPRRERIWIGVENGGFWQQVSYNRVPHFCSFCHKIGHIDYQCKKKLRIAPDRFLDKENQQGSKQKIRQIYRPREAPFAGKQIVENQNRFSSLSQLGDGCESANPVLCDRIHDPGQGHSQVASEKVIEAPSSVAIIQQVSTVETNNNTLPSFQGVDEYNGTNRFSFISSVSQKENSRMMFKDKSSQKLSQSQVLAEECVASGVLFSDTRLTRAKAKAIVSHYTISSIDE